MFSVIYEWKTPKKNSKKASVGVGSEKIENPWFWEENIHQRSSNLFVVCKNLENK